MPARKKITKIQKGYAENLVKGMSKDRSAIMAGATTDAVKRMEVSPLVKEELARIRKKVIENTGITKEEVVEMMMDAANMARITGDPMGLIAAARELGKMLGFYAPEVKKIEKNIDQASLRKALKDMNDDELFKLAHARTIDSTAERVPDVRQLQDLETPAPVLPGA